MIHMLQKKSQNPKTNKTPNQTKSTKTNKTNQMKELQQNCQKHGDNEHEDMQAKTQVASVDARKDTYLLL